MKLENAHTLGLIIGSGKISSHIPHFLPFHSNSFIVFDKNKWKAAVQRASQSYEFKEVLTDLSLDVPENINKLNIYLAVKDFQIASVYEDFQSHFAHLKWQQDKKISIDHYHFSGTKYFKDIVGIHPLMTFVKEQTYTADVYEQIPLYVDHKQEFKKWPQKMKLLNPADKALYHALCVMLGNFPQYLVWEIKEKFPQEFCFKDFQCLAEHSVKNVFQYGQGALSGPMVRNDLETLQKHKDVLKDHSLEKVYQIFSNHFAKEVFYVEAK